MPRQDTQNRVIFQADKLLTHACENRNMLLEYDKDVLPYSLRTILKKSSFEKEAIEARFTHLLSMKNSIEGSAEGRKESVFSEVHKSLVASAERLVNVSNQLNKSMTVDGDI
jgi:hypothetical protein